MKLVENYKKLSSRTKSIANTGFAVFFVAAFGGALALIQINENVRSFVAEDEAAEKVIIENKSESSSYELVNDYNHEQASCFFTSINFELDGEPLAISEERWREESRTTDVVQGFQCVLDGEKISVDIKNLFDSDPGTVVARATTDQARFEKLTIGIVLFDWDGNWCETVKISLPEKSSDGYNFYSAEVEGLFEAEMNCELLSIYSFSALDKTKEIDVANSLRIDEMVVNSTPNGCSLIAAWLTSSESYTPEYDLVFIDYLNANYPSYELWESDSYIGPEYYIPDESLAEKIGLHPTWSFDCGETETPFSVGVGGFVVEQKDGIVNYRPPHDNELAIDLDLWFEGEHDVKLAVELYDKQLQSCGLFELQLALSPEYGNYFSFSDAVLLNDVDTHLCQVVSLQSFEIIER